MLAVPSAKNASLPSDVHASELLRRFGSKCQWSPWRSFPQAPHRVPCRISQHSCGTRHSLICLLLLSP